MNRLAELGAVVPPIPPLPQCQLGSRRRDLARGRPVAGGGGAAEAGRRGGAATAEPRGEKAGIERVPRPGRIGRRDGARGDIEPQGGLPGPAGEDGRACRAPLHDGDRGEGDEAGGVRSAEERGRLGEVREQEVGRDPGDQGVGRRPAAGEERRRRGEVHRHEGAIVPGERDRPRRGLPERRPKERVARQVEDPGAAEPRRSEVVRPQEVRRPAIGHEAALARGVDDHPDAGRAGCGRPRRAYRHPVGAERGQGARPGPSRPTAQTSVLRMPSRASQRAVLAADPPWWSRTTPGTSVPVLQRPRRCQDDVQGQVPENHGTRARPAAGDGGGSERRHRPEDTPPRRRRGSPPGDASRETRPPEVHLEAPSRKCGSAVSGPVSCAPRRRASHEGLSAGRGEAPRAAVPGRPAAVPGPRTAPPYNGPTPPPPHHGSLPAMTTLSPEQLDRLAIDTIRTLAIDGVQQANSGHPGAPMGMAPMAYTLWTRFLRHAPTHPDWPDRDRFVLSAGHASMLLYSLLHLTGYDLPLDELRRFRQWGSRTPGHPEFGVTPGVEATTGPLGQGVANAVGMAIAERRLAEEFNRPGHAVVDHWTYAICSDGDLQEGIASEAASLAGHLKLGKLVMLYDDNQIQLDGPTAMAFSEDVLARFRAYGWQTLRVKDGNDVGAIEAAIRLARSDDRPVDRRRAHPHRLRLAQQGRTARRPTAPRWAPTRSA